MVAQADGAAEHFRQHRMVLIAIGRLGVLVQQQQSGSSRAVNPHALVDFGWVADRCSLITGLPVAATRAAAASVGVFKRGTL
jgi:hypothetical protein